MSNYETTLEAIECKISMLIQDNERMHREVSNLKEQIAMLTEANEDKDILINNLKEESKILKIRNTLNEKGDSTEIKLKINQLIRTIDKSLVLLNKME